MWIKSQDNQIIATEGMTKIYADGRRVVLRRVNETCQLAIMVSDADAHKIVQLIYEQYSLHRKSIDLPAEILKINRLLATKEVPSGSKSTQAKAKAPDKVPAVVTAPSVI